jgi:hypothetical protein
MAEPIQIDQADFVALPSKVLPYRGVDLTRSTLIRGMHAGLIKSRLFRQPGSVKGRRYILRESLDQYLAACMADVPLNGVEPATVANR